MRIYRAVRNLSLRVEGGPYVYVTVRRGGILTHVNPLRAKTRQFFLTQSGEVAYVEGWSLESLLNEKYIESVEE
jgi:hypothetical protein